MWIVHEGVVKLYDADVLFLMLSVMLVAAPFGLLPTQGAKCERVDVYVHVRLVQLVKVRPVSVETEVSPPHQWCHQMSFIKMHRSLSKPWC